MERIEKLTVRLLKDAVGKPYITIDAPFSPVQITLWADEIVIEDFR